MTPIPAILDRYQDQGYGLPSNHGKVVGLFYTLQKKTLQKIEDQNKNARLFQSILEISSDLLNLLIS